MNNLSEKMIPLIAALLFILSTSGFAGSEDSTHTIKPSSLLLASDSTWSPFQFSVLPFIGTKGLHGAAATVDYSFNLIGGYNRNIRKAEFAGLFNADLGTVQYFQYAGLGNFVARDVNGFQFAGCINVVEGNLRGLQMAGIGNSVKEKTEGVQFAGIYNINNAGTRASQFAGILNLNNDTMEGIQCAGVININQSTARSVSVSGLLNHQTGAMKGAQIGGLGNIAMQAFDGMQVAGFANISGGKHRGTQISGFLNVANKIIGTQIGVFNFSDSITGVPVGLFSYAKNGYHKLEIATNETFYVNLSFLTGAKVFHNIITAGIRPDSSRYPVWYIGYGFGSTIAISAKTALVINVTSSQISRGDIITQKMNLLNKGYLGLDIQLGKKIALTTGPELNAWFTNPQYKEYPSLFGEIKPEVFFNETSKNKKFNAKIWIGWRLGIRFF